MRACLYSSVNSINHMIAHRDKSIYSDIYTVEHDLKHIRVCTCIQASVQKYLHKYIDM